MPLTYNNASNYKTPEKMAIDNVLLVEAAGVVDLWVHLLVLLASHMKTANISSLGLRNQRVTSGKDARQLSMLYKFVLDFKQIAAIRKQSHTGEHSRKVTLRRPRP